MDAVNGELERASLASAASIHKLLRILVDLIHISTVVGARGHRIRGEKK